MSISRQYRGFIRPAFGASHKPEVPKRADPLIEARAQVKALSIKYARAEDEIARLKRELTKRR